MIRGGSGGADLCDQEAQDYSPHSAIWNRIVGLDKHEMTEDVAADDELRDLDRCDELRHRSWCFNLQRSNSKVAEHY